MPQHQNRFQNPANGETYNWYRNHSPDGEEDTGKTRNISRVANTSNQGVILQQGDDGTYELKFSGTLDNRAQWRQLWKWYALSERQTIYFRDFDLQEYEVQITALTGKRKGNLPRPSRDPERHTWTYTITMAVIDFRAGDMKDMGVKA